MRRGDSRFWINWIRESGEKAHGEELRECDGLIVNLSNEKGEKKREENTLSTSSR